MALAESWIPDAVPAQGKSVIQPVAAATLANPRNPAGKLLKASVKREYLTPLE
jgi:hypothetical protein